VVTPENFAQSVVDDYGLTPAFHTVITKSIQDQLSDFKAHSAGYDGDGEDIVVEEDTLERGTLGEKETLWWARWRRSIRTDAGYVRVARKGVQKRRKRRKLGVEDAHVLSSEDGERERPMTVQELKVDEQAMHEEMRILIKVCGIFLRSDGLTLIGLCAAGYHCRIHEAR
jgi:SWI/SNF-related matrix-associated actin-dependent regulator of chromatin subfamily B member 1